jgi:hypothetical protein
MSAPILEPEEGGLPGVPSWLLGLLLLLAAVLAIVFLVAANVVKTL